MTSRSGSSKTNIKLCRPKNPAAEMGEGEWVIIICIYWTCSIYCYCLIPFYALLLFLLLSYPHSLSLSISLKHTHSFYHSLLLLLLLSHTHTHSLSLSLTHTHAHTSCLSVYGPFRGSGARKRHPYTLLDADEWKKIVERLSLINTATGKVQ